MKTIDEKETFISELHKLIPKHLGLQAVIFSLHEKYASSQSGWTDEDMREIIIKNAYEFEKNRFIIGVSNIEEIIVAIKQSLPPRKTIEHNEGELAVKFAEFLGENNYQMQGGVWRKFNWRGAMNEKYTTSELFNSPEFKLWKEKRNA